MSWDKIKKKLLCSFILFSKSFHQFNWSIDHHGITKQLIIMVLPNHSRLPKTLTIVSNHVSFQITCLNDILLVWQSTLSRGEFTSVAECTIRRVFYYYNRVFYLKDMLLVWHSALSKGYIISVTECFI